MWGPKLNGGDEFDQGEDHSGQFQDNPVQAYDHPEYVSRQAMTILTHLKILCQMTRLEQKLVQCFHQVIQSF